MVRQFFLNLKYYYNSNPYALNLLLTVSNNLLIAQEKYYCEKLITKQKLSFYARIVFRTLILLYIEKNL